MHNTAVLASVLTGATASQSVQTVMDKAPDASEKRVAATIADEVGRIEKHLSLVLAHVEGHYESQLALARLKLVTIRMYWPTMIGSTILGGVIGFAVGHFFR